MTKLYKLLLFISCFYITQNTYAAERLSSKDYQKLVDLGFNKLDAYADDYSDSEAYWYSLEEHLSLKPKFLALLTQPMKVDGKEQVNRHVYNSKHHFFASRKEKCDKDGSKTLSFLKKCKVLKMPVIDDSLISVENFAKMTLDHCNETKEKNLYHYQRILAEDAKKDKKYYIYIRQFYTTFYTTVLYYNFILQFRKLSDKNTRQFPTTEA